MKFETISVPLMRPTAWPFDGWIDEEIRNALGVQFTELSFSLIDCSIIALRESNRNLGAENFIFGFVFGSNSYANIKLIENTAYIAIDILLFFRAMCMASEKAEDLLSSLRSDPRSCIKHATDIMMNGGDSLDIIIRAAAAVFSFVVNHEISHLNAGHVQLSHDNIINKSYARVMEFCADRAALTSAYLVLVDPLVRDDSPRRRPISELVHEVSKSFGKSLAFMLLSKYNPDKRQSLYPDPGERLLLLAGNCLTGCGGAGDAAFKIDKAIQCAIISGIRMTIFSISDKDLAPLPSSLNPLMIDRRLPERVNCVGCSVWARRLYEAANPITAEVITHKDILGKYNISGPNSFTLRSFAIAETYRGREKHVCRLDYPFWLGRVIARILKSCSLLNNRTR